MHTASESPSRPRVLQLSYACSPMRGSEAGVGWHRAVQSAKHFDTWVICEEHEFAGEIREYLAAHGDIPGLNFVFVPINQREWSLGQSARLPCGTSFCGAGIAGPTGSPDNCTSRSASIWCIW